MTTQKQIIANRKNAQRGGVKTLEGREMVKFNALKHGVLLQAVTEYEQPIYEDIQERLFKEYQPKTLLEEILIERVAICYLRLQRAVKAESEFMQSRLDPHVESSRFGFAIDIDIEVINEGYHPVITPENVEQLQNT